MKAVEILLLLLWNAVLSRYPHRSSISPGALCLCSWHDLVDREILPSSGTVIAQAKGTSDSGFSQSPISCSPEKERTGSPSVFFEVPSTGGSDLLLSGTAGAAPARCRGRHGGGGSGSARHPASSVRDAGRLRSRSTRGCQAECLPPWRRAAASGTQARGRLWGSPPTASASRVSPTPSGRAGRAVRRIPVPTPGAAGVGLAPRAVGSAAAQHGRRDGARPPHGAGPCASGQSAAGARQISFPRTSEEISEHCALSHCLSYCCQRDNTRL